MRIVESGRQRLVDTSLQLEGWLADRQDSDGPIGLGTRLYQRDRESLGSVLGSAMALRLFLFVVPANVALLGLANLLRLTNLLDDALGSSPTTGEMARNYSDLSFGNSLWVALTGIVLMLWAGRTLARVMGACSGAAWQLGARGSRVGARAMFALIWLVFALTVATYAFARIRDAAGLPIEMVVWVAVTVTFLVGWFLVELALPRATPDPGALLPGAAVVGVGFAVLQWFMQIYLPGKIERTTDTLGSLAVTVASLGYFFFVGRLLAASFVVNAVVFERWGSLSRVVFALPGVRRLPARYERLRTFFDLPGSPDITAAEEAGGDAES